jgi:PTS system mannitol-specific IIB component
MNGSDVKKLVVACDAAMGSSVMLASQLRKRLKKTAVTVEHTSVGSIPTDADVIITHAGLVDRVRQSAPEALIVGFNVFIGDPAVDNVVEAIKNGTDLDA